MNMNLLTTIKNILDRFRFRPLNLRISKTEGMTLKEIIVARSGFVSLEPDLRKCWYEFPDVAVPSLTNFSTSLNLDMGTVCTFSNNFYQ